MFRPTGVTDLWRSVSICDGSSYNGSTLIQCPIELSEPIVYVNFSYRLNAFGRLNGKEALAGGVANVGLYDREYRFDNYQTFVASD